MIIFLRNLMMMGVCMYVEYETGRIYRRNNFFYKVDFDDPYIYILDKDYNYIYNHYLEFDAKRCHNCGGISSDFFYENQYKERIPIKYFILNKKDPLKIIIKQFAMEKYTI